MLMFSCKGFGYAHTILAVVYVFDDLEIEALNRFFNLVDFELVPYVEQ